jgi:hypothetical protein
MARAKNGVFTIASSCGTDCLPNSGRSGIFDAQPCEVELIFANAMHQLDARYRNGRIPEAFEAEHCIDPGLDVPMILLDQIVQVLRRSQPRVRGQKTGSPSFRAPRGERQRNRPA